MHKKNLPLVSVIMNCFNSESFLKEAIESVLNQSYTNWELIIWDNQSTDETANISNSYDDNRIKYFLADKYTALGEARNLAIEKSKGEIIGFLDSDDIWLPKKLEKQVPIFQSGRVGIVICDTLFFNEKGINKQLYKKKKPPTGMVFKELLSDYFVSLETAMVRRQAFDDLNYWFDTRFEVIEEYDLFVRLGYYWELAYVDQLLSKWRVHNSSWTWSKSNLFPKETKLMLESLKLYFPMDDYSEEMMSVEQNIAFEEAQAFWKKGNRQDARKILRPKIKGSFKYGLLFLIMFFPFGFYEYLQRLRGNVFPV